MSLCKERSNPNNRVTAWLTAWNKTKSQLFSLRFLCVLLKEINRNHEMVWTTAALWVSSGYLCTGSSHRARVCVPTLEGLHSITSSKLQHATVTAICSLCKEQKRYLTAVVFYSWKSVVFSAFHLCWGLQCLGQHLRRMCSVLYSNSNELLHARSFSFPGIPKIFCSLV